MAEGVSLPKKQSKKEVLFYSYILTSSVSFMSLVSFLIAFMCMLQSLSSEEEEEKENYILPRECFFSSSLKTKLHYIYCIKKTGEARMDRGLFIKQDLVPYRSLNATRFSLENGTHRKLCV